MAVGSIPHSVDFTDQILPVRTELCRFRVGFAAKFDFAGFGGRMPFVLVLSDGCFSPEQINLGA